MCLQCEARDCTYPCSGNKAHEQSPDSLDSSEESNSQWLLQHYTSNQIPDSLCELQAGMLASQAHPELDLLFIRPGASLAIPESILDIPDTCTGCKILCVSCFNPLLVPQADRRSRVFNRT